MLPFIEMGDLEKLEILSEEKAQKNKEGSKKPQHFSFNICLSFIGGKSSGTHDSLPCSGLAGYKKWLGSAAT